MSQSEAQTAPPATGGKAVDVIVVGAGLAGLACAHALHRAGRRVLCLEAGPRPGGMVKSLRQDGFLFEAGPNTVQASAQHFRQLVDQVGLTAQLQVSGADANRRFLWHKGRLVALPHSPKGLLSTELLSLRGKWKMLSEPLRKLRAPAADAPEPSFEAFLTERIGREATRTLAGAFVRGVYASEIGQLGAQSAFARLWTLAHEHGGLVRGMLAKRKIAKREAEQQTPGSPEPQGPATKRTDLLTFAKGLAELPNAIAAELGDRLRLEAPVQSLSHGPAGWDVRLGSGEVLHSSGLVLAVPSAAAHRLLQPLAPESVPLPSLGEIEHASVTVVHMGLQGAQLPAGFGFLVPPDEEGNPGTPRVLGTLFPSRIFGGRAPAGGSTVTSMLRGHEVEAMDEGALLQHAHGELVAAIGTEAAGQVTSHSIQRWAAAIPRYTIGHASRMQALRSALRQALPSLHLAGSYLSGVSVDDTIRSGLTAAQAWLETQSKEGAA